MEKAERISKLTQVLLETNLADTEEKAAEMAEKMIEKEEESIKDMIEKLEEEHKGHFEEKIKEILHIDKEEKENLKTSEENKDKGEDK